MKQGMLTILVLMILGWVVLFPKKEVEVFLDTEAMKVPSFVVHIEGEVVMPTTMTYVHSMTLADLIEDAYGLTEQADISKINFEKVIHGSQTIIIPKMTDTEQVITTRININKASFKELLEIPGITETRAASIIIYREANGPFQSLDELIHVKNIGVVTLEKIKPYLKLG